jgi:uncharacterized membrane protein (DUF4010 family)
VVGGLYSSTMTVIVVSKKSKDAPAVAGQAATAILFAVSMMYLRLLALVAIFRITAAVIVGPALVALASLAAGYGVWLRGRRARTSTTERAAAAGADETAVGAAFRRNPLELNAALLFAVLFAVVSVATKYVLESFADLGLRVLSFLVGFSDITPFVVSLLQGDFGIGDAQIAQAIVIASASNNVLKMGYAYAVGSRRTAALAAPGVAALVLLSFTYAFAFM